MKATSTLALVKRAVLTLSSSALLHCFQHETKKDVLRSKVQSEVKHLKANGCNHKEDLHPALASKVQAALQGRG